MKQRLFFIIFTMFILGALLLAGCGKTEEKILTPDDMEPLYYTNETDLPADAYYIVREEEDKKGNKIIKYYPMLFAEKTYTEVNTYPVGSDPHRITWVNYNIDEGLIPTMYAGDKMIYKSSTTIPVIYSLEKFFDDGYTLGVAGLTQDLSKNYRFTDSSITMSTSDAAGFSTLEAESIYLVSVGDTRITPANITESGTVSGLNLMEKYDCDIRTGTEKIAAVLTCNIHAFSSAETYLFGEFTFITEHIAELHIPEYVTTGYYNINGGGFYRYIADENITSYKDLKENDYNKTIYTFNDNDQVNGTTIGYMLDENNFLVKDPLSSELGYNGSLIIKDDNQSNTEKDDISKYWDKTQDGDYIGIFTINEVSTSVVSGDEIYCVAKCEDSISGTIIQMKIIENGYIKPEVGKKYMMSFRELKNSSAYEAISFAIADE